MIQLSKIGHRFGDHEVLRDIDLLLSEHMTHVFLGASGCGKSTLLRILAGLLTPTVGHVEMFGKKLRTYGGKELARLFGYVVQNAALFPHLTVRQNVLLPCRAQKQSVREMEERLASLVDMVQLYPELLPKYPSQLSGGQQQRVALMRALVLDPQVLFLDEPLSALDPMIRSGLQDELKDLFSRLNKTVVFVTHDLAEAAYLGDRIYLLHEGRIEQTGTYKELSRTPRTPFVRAFFEAQTRRITEYTDG